MSLKKILQWSLLVVSLLLAGLVLYWLTPGRIIFTDDLALSLAVGKLLLKGKLFLLGPPSHLGGRHLGPIYYWYVALTMFLGAANIQATVIISSFFKLAAVALMARCAMFFGTERTRWGMALGTLICVCSSQYLWVLTKDWHAHFLLIPAVVTLYLAFRNIESGYRFFLPFLFSASILLQTHYGSLSVVVGMGLVVLASLWRRYRSGDKPAPGFWTARAQSLWLLLTAVSWLPLLVYELLYRSNLLSLVHGISSTSGRRLGLLRSALTSYRFFRKHTLGGMSFEQLVYPLPWSDIWICVFAISAVCFAAWYALRSASREQRWYLACLILPTVLITLHLAQVPLPAYLYYWNQILPLPAIAGGIVFGEAIGWLAAGSAAGRLRRAAAGLFLALFVLCAVRAVYFNIKGTSASKYRRDYFTLKHAEEVAATIRRDLGDADAAFIRGYKSAGVLRDAYYYLLFDKPYALMKYWDFYRERPEFKRHRKRKKGQTPPKPAGPRPGYLVICPAVDELERTIVFKKLAKEWLLDAELPLDLCPTCEKWGCLIARLKDNRQ